jgi:hypothetical protein
MMLKSAVAFAVCLAASSASAEERQITAPKPACVHKDVLNALATNQLSRYFADQGGLRAEDQGTEADYRNYLFFRGECVMFDPGETVFIEDAGLFSSQIRRKGETRTFWISMDAFAR